MNIDPTTGMTLARFSQGNNFHTLPKPQKPGTMSEADFAKIQATAEDFEANFVANMLRPMFKDLSTDGAFGGGHAESVFRDQMIEEYGKSVAAAGGIGIADNLTRQLISLQEGANHGK